MLKLLARLAVENGSAKSFYFSPVTDIDRMEKLRQSLVFDSIPPEMVEVISSSKTGAVVFWGVAKKLLILPPFHVTDNYVAFGYEIEPLHSMLQSKFRVALVLVRMGAFAIGICEGQELIDSKVYIRLVHAKHKKGGSSQLRFQRRRQKEVDDFVKRVCIHIEEKLNPYASRLDYLIYGGGREAIRLLHKKCHFLHQFNNRMLPPLLDIPAPRRATLEKVLARLWSSQVIEWQET